jgi:hypothetical protein
MPVCRGREAANYKMKVGVRELLEGIQCSSVAHFEFEGVDEGTVVAHAPHCSLLGNLEVDSLPYKTGGLRASDSLQKDGAGAESSELCFVALSAPPPCR